MQWSKTPAGDCWLLMDGPRTLAEVQADKGRFRWQRFTTLDGDGAPPAAGVEGSKKDAMREATRGLKVKM